MKILNFGSLNIDYVYQMDHFVREGETISSDSLEIFCGGKGLNQSLALSKSGVKVWHAGAVGELDGEILTQQLEQFGIDTKNIKRVKNKTGHAIIQKNQAGQNGILLYGGANQEITKNQVDQVLNEFGKGDFLILQNEINEVGYIMEQAYGKGMRIVLNPSPMNRKIWSYPLHYVEFFILNEIEAGDICQKSGSGRELLDQLTEKFPNAKILLTLGQDGSLYKDGDQVYEQEIYRVKVVDTTGAGDTFTGYFIGGLALGETPEQALDHAAKAASIAVSRAGAAPSIPTRDEVLNGY
ncbi:MAG: ribokinase [Lachnospiraceae bacterium]|uniref:ribokinase n=1 Tax=Clostridium sp. WB02_MRS01 TaxID=2605777 RepID=UPI0012B1DC21|nr:ribokinase [Clostridium sp. WB02_MRS01]MBW4848406.1 ribokinase [Lachnospiraceae bacterium]MSS09034.1 ribokinase [Clostridium sp. WB02_MRS01]